MESSNTIHRMASYDFKSPIDVVWFEEENSRGEIDLTSSPDLVAESVESVPNKLIVKDNTNNDKQVNQESDHISNDNQVNSITTNKRKLKPSQTSAKRKKNCKSNDPSISKTDIQNINQNNDNLKTLSKYLTLIVESYNQYLCVLNNTKCTYNDVSISKKRYLTIKFHFFQTACKYVKQYIIPNENNQAFIQNFLNYTSNMANNRIKINCNNDITEIYFEMIKWVKQKLAECDTSILRQQLGDPSITRITSATNKDSGMDVQQYSTNPNQDQYNIFSSGPQGRQISISVNKSLICNNNQVLNNVIQSPYTSTVLEQNQITQQNNTLPTIGNFSFRQTDVTQNAYGNHNHDMLGLSEIRMPQHCQSTPNDLRNVVNENNHFSHNIYNNYYHTTNNYQNRVMHQNMLRYEDSSLRTFIREQYNTTREDILRQPPPYHAQQYIREHPNHIVTANPVEQPYFSSGPDLTRSSVSTDSGFISPGRSKSDNNSVEDIMNDLFELENMVQSRKSSHSVICHVCQKNSKLLCSACYKTNYCSVKCQRTDWDVHKVLCRP